MGGLKSSNLAQKNVLSLAKARHKNLFCTILPLFSPLRHIGVMQEVYYTKLFTKQTSSCLLKYYNWRLNTI